MFANIERPGRLRSRTTTSDHCRSTRCPTTGARPAGSGDRSPTSCPTRGPPRRLMTRSSRSAGRACCATRARRARAARRSRPQPIVRRADLASISREDVHPGRLSTRSSDLRDGATLVVTQGDRGGIVATSVDGRVRLRHYPAVRRHRPLDPTGAGRHVPRSAHRRVGRAATGRRPEGPRPARRSGGGLARPAGQGLGGVPDREAVARRMAEGASAFERAQEST